MTNKKGIAPIVIVLILAALFVTGILIWQNKLVPKEETKALDLTRFSIKDLSLLSSYTLEAETTEPWEIIKGEVKNAFCQNFMATEEQKPMLVYLDIREYITLEKAEKVYNELYETKTELGSITEKNKENIKIGNYNAKLSLRRPDTGSYYAEILILNGSTVIRLWEGDFSQYYQNIIIEIAEKIVKKI